MAWVGLGEVVLGLRGVFLGLGVVGFGVRVMGLRRLSLGLRRGVLGFGAQWVELGYWELGFGVVGVVWGLWGLTRARFRRVKEGLWVVEHVVHTKQSITSEEISKPIVEE